MGNKSYRTRWLRFLRLLERIHWGASEFARTLVWPRPTTRVGPFPSTLPISFWDGFCFGGTHLRRFLQHRRNRGEALGNQTVDIIGFGRAISLGTQLRSRESACATSKSCRQIARDVTLQGETRFGIGVKIVLQRSKVPMYSADRLDHHRVHIGRSTAHENRRTHQVTWDEFTNEAFVS